MSNCPKCGNPIDADFGMVTCPGCEVILFVDVNGQIQIDGASAESSLDEGSEGEGQELDSSEQYLSMPEVDADITPEESGISDYDIPGDDVGEVEESIDQPGENFEPESSLPSFAIGQSPDLSSTRIPKVEGDLSEVADFANSEISLGKEGNYLYDIIISNIDTAEVKEGLRRALEDRRFNWDVDELLNGTQQGCLRISRVNSVKSTVLINRIKNLPLMVTWEQHAINQDSDQI